MKVDVFNMQGEKIKRVELPAEIFEAPVNVVGEDLPGDVTGAVTDLKTPRHSMVLGLLRYGVKQGNPQRSILPDLDRGLNLVIKRSWRAIMEGMKF